MKVSLLRWSQKKKINNINVINAHLFLAKYVINDKNVLA